MSIVILSSVEQERMRAASRVAATTLAEVGAALRPSMTTLDIDGLVRRSTAKQGGAPSQLGYCGFPAAVCTSRNQVVCHGIPSPLERLQPGDIINVDVTTELDGFHGDTSATFFVGEPSPAARKIVRVARKCLDVGVGRVRAGVRLYEIGDAIETAARTQGCSPVRDFGGHGIGRQMHAEPHVPLHGGSGARTRLRAGMAITIEPMINLGGPGVRVLEDGWTAVTLDGSLSAQFEHTVLVTTTGCEVLTHIGCGFVQG